MSECKRCILELHGLLLMMEHMEVKMLSKYSFTSSHSDTHLHTSVMTCLGLVFISLIIPFYRYPREGGLLSGILLGEGSV